MKKILLALTFACLSSAALADRITSFHNNSNYDIRIYEMGCAIQQDDTQECGDDGYIGYVGAHQTITRIQKTSNDWKLAGPHIYAANLEKLAVEGTHLNLINELPICNDIHEDNVNGSLTFDIDPKTKKITCVDKIETNQNAG